MARKHFTVPFFVFMFMLMSCSFQYKNQKHIITKTETPEKKIGNGYKTTVFDAGQDGIDSYRIPSLVSTQKGSLLVFTEARKMSSTDKTPTDIAVKRSIDQGKTWSDIQIIAHGGDNAFMDPCAVTDAITGKVFLFTTLWPQNDHSSKGNTAWVITSDDDGVTWSEPRNITTEITASAHYVDGFGPGAGIQMKGDSFNDRLIVPTRQSDGTNTKNRTIFSDDHGITWQTGEPAPDGGEFMIAEAPANTLIYNLRAGKGKRVVARSYDGGVTWGDSRIDFGLQSCVDYGGCQASIYGTAGVLFYTGPAGGLGSETREDRQYFRIYRSFDGGKKWPQHHILYDRSAGYSCIAQLPDGHIAVVFETGDGAGFPKMTPGNRPPGWMRLDVIVLPPEIAKKDFWF